MGKIEREITKEIVRKLTGQTECWFLKVHGHAMQRAGVPDLLVCHKGSFFAFEVKRPGRDAAPLQAFEIRRIRKAGGRAGVVRCAQDVQHMLQEANHERTENA